MNFSQHKSSLYKFQFFMSDLLNHEYQFGFLLWYSWIFYYLLNFIYLIFFQNIFLRLIRHFWVLSSAHYQIIIRVHPLYVRRKGLLWRLNFYFYFLLWYCWKFYYLLKFICSKFIFQNTFLKVNSTPLSVENSALSNHYKSAFTICQEKRIVETP